MTFGHLEKSINISTIIVVSLYWEEQRLFLLCLSDFQFFPYVFFHSSNILLSSSMLTCSISLFIDDKKGRNLWENLRGLKVFLECFYFT